LDALRRIEKIIQDDDFEKKKKKTVLFKVKFNPGLTLIMAFEQLGPSVNHCRLQEVQEKK